MAPVGLDFVWHLRLLHWELPLDGTLLSMRALGAGDAHEPPKRRARRGCVSLPAVFFEGNPLDLAGIGDVPVVPVRAARAVKLQSKTQISEPLGSIPTTCVWPT